MPVDFRTTPVTVTFLHGDLFRNIPESNMSAPFHHHIANTVHSPLPMHSSVYEGWLSMLLRVLLSEARQVVVCIPVVRIAARSLTWLTNQKNTSLRYSAISVCSGPSGQSSFHNPAREISSLLTCKADSRPSTNLSMRRDCAAFGVGR